jgi:hypothetical protein
MTMQWNGLIGLALGVLAASTQIGPPPVVLDLGPIKPTPAPTAKRAEKKRLISTITVQNSANGDSVISFEATDVADEGTEKLPLVAARTYSMADADNAPEATRETARRIVSQIRELEREMLHFAEQVGPPKPRQPLVQ